MQPRAKQFIPQGKQFLLVVGALVGTFLLGDLFGTMKRSRGSPQVQETDEQASGESRTDSDPPQEKNDATVGRASESGMDASSSQASSSLLPKKLEKAHFSQESDARRRVHNQRREGDKESSLRATTKGAATEDEAKTAQDAAEKSKGINVVNVSHRLLGNGSQVESETVCEISPRCDGGHSFSSCVLEAMHA